MDEKKEMMKCGHQANARTKDGAPVCAICIGLHSGAGIVENTEPDLAGRQAQCSCGALRPSIERERLAFFAYRPDREHDQYYCGCRGWD